MSFFGLSKSVVDLHLYDDCATLLDALPTLAELVGEEQATGKGRADLLARWRRRGLRAFDQDKDKEQGAMPGPGTPMPGGRR